MAGNLLTPPVLFFLLGMAATLMRSDLEIPEGVKKGMSLYLLFAIGMHGGVELSRGGLQMTTLTPLAAGVLAGGLTPLLAFVFLRKRLTAENAAAVAATYGSISAVTFITACSFLDGQEVRYGGHMVAAMALMEAPAILVGVLLARRFGARAGSGHDASIREMARESVMNGPVFLLLGSLGIGILTGDAGWEAVKPFAYDPFKGVLCLFLLDMGLVAAKRLDDLQRQGTFLMAFSIAFPLVMAALGLCGAYAMGLGRGDALLFIVLCASASYIAVPAAARVAIPRANPGLYLPMALGVTFPFNIALGIPLYFALIQAFWG